MSAACDALVIGGGPAGATAARLLASWGHRVRIVASGIGRSHRGVTLAESIPPSAGKLFGALGVSDAIDRAGFVRHSGHTVWWATSDPRVEYFGEGRLGWQVTADRLEAVLMEAAQSAGAQVERGTLNENDARAINASYRLDCSGRSGVLARSLGVRRNEPQLRSVALVGRWRVGTSPKIPDATHTLIESYQDGWVWSVPSERDVRHVAVMVDPRSSNLAKEAHALDVYRGEIAKTRHMRLLTSAASLIDTPAGWDASMYSSMQYVDGDSLLVGDAGSFVDPLSSAGIRKAMISAWVAAIAVHTALLRPDRRDLAMRFFNQREADMYERLRRLTAGHLSEAARGHPDPFWSDRTGLAGVDARPPSSVHAGIDEAEVRATFERMRHEPTLGLRLAPGARIEARPVIEGCEIVPASHLVSRSGDDAVRFLHDVEAPTLVDVATEFDDAGEMFGAYCRRRGPVTLPSFLTALSTLVARGWLCYKDRTEAADVPTPLA